MRKHVKIKGKGRRVGRGVYQEGGLEQQCVSERHGAGDQGGTSHSSKDAPKVFLSSNLAKHTEPHTHHKGEWGAAFKLREDSWNSSDNDGCLTAVRPPSSRLLNIILKIFCSTYTNQPSAHANKHQP